MCLALACARIHTSAYWTSAPYRGRGRLRIGYGTCFRGKEEYMRVPDNRKALDELWELSIIVPLAAYARHAMLRGSRSSPVTSRS